MTNRSSPDVESDKKSDISRWGERLLIEAEMLNPYFMPKFIFKLDRRLNWVFSRGCPVSSESMRLSSAIKHLSTLLSECMKLRERKLETEDKLRMQIISSIQPLIDELEAGISDRDP